MRESWEKLDISRDRDVHIDEKWPSVPVSPGPVFEEKLEVMAKIMLKHELNFIKAGDIEISKNTYKAVEAASTVKPKTAEEIERDAEDLLFHSSGGPIGKI